jgi:hypothetical protein
MNVLPKNLIEVISADLADSCESLEERLVRGRLLPFTRADDHVIDSMTLQQTERVRAPLVDAPDIGFPYPGWQSVRPDVSRIPVTDDYPVDSSARRDGKPNSHAARRHQSTF